MSAFFIVLDGAARMEEDILTEKINELISPFLKKEGVELVELTYSPSKLKLLVWQKGGIDIAKCAQLNREIGAILDETDTIDFSFTLEVSSPGLDRPLVCRRDFERVRGEIVKVFLKESIVGETTTAGKLIKVDEDAVFLQPKEETLFRIPLKDIKRGKVEIF